MENYEINGILEMGDKTIRYTACIADRFSTYLDNKTAIATAIVIDYIGKGRVQDGKQTEVLATVLNSDMTIDETLALLDSVKAPRKPREMSEKSKTKSKVLKLAKIGGITSKQMADICGISENEVNEILKANNK